MPVRPAVSAFRCLLSVASLGENVVRFEERDGKARRSSRTLMEFSIDALGSWGDTGRTAQCVCRGPSGFSEADWMRAFMALTSAFRPHPSPESLALTLAKAIGPLVALSIVFMGRVEGADGRRRQAAHIWRPRHRDSAQRGQAHRVTTSPPWNGAMALRNAPSVSFSTQGGHNPSARCPQPGSKNRLRCSRTVDGSAADSFDCVARRSIANEAGDE
ncbi:uncharacterized protein BXZ73DRAFT_82721 [Epithele typhae]|uniref:uncharacterized protein n=1 Tax=Epithele typhae TaxID=378194 RepID=UPI002008825B|nr:uncharacterized protein BXZ73DRAFT_82721 [Epithele typhae]KAH9911541.1 hypothetical protein BXZ73DRAFT_82721 [Epithele typhae]